MTSQIDLPVTRVYTGRMSSPHPHWLGDTETKPAPEPLSRVQALVNTIELPEGRDRLADRTEAAHWLVSAGLLANGSDLRPADLDLVRGVREGLRALLVANAGGPPPTADVFAPLRQVATEGTARADFGDGGEIRLS